MKSRFYILLLSVLIFANAKAQLTFPAGNSLVLNTHEEVLYSETGIFFNTGSNKITDYNWTKIGFDSLDSRWDFQACMNGDCKVGLPHSGPFITDFGINDTTGFIKFHVNTFGFSGASTLYYEVAHKSNTSDRSVLTFTFNYKNNTGICEETSGSDLYSVYPNPATDRINIINLTGSKGDVRIIQSDGKLVLEKELRGTDVQQIETEGLVSGVYFLEISSGNKITHRLIRVENE